MILWKIRIQMMVFLYFFATTVNIIHRGFMLRKNYLYGA
jgi:hypothetical protein